MIPSHLPFLAGLAIAAVAVASCAAIGRILAARSLEGWYLTIAKPGWTPPDRVIGTVWVILFALIGVAAALVWRQRLDAPFTAALALNLVLNVLWSWLFFAHRSPPAALADLFVLEVTCIGLSTTAWRISALAGLLLVPYVLWVAFAGALNIAIVWLNRPR